MHTFKSGLILLMALSIAGCVERKETIKVAANGTVHAAARFKADSREELYQGRVPSPSMGWTVTESMDEDKAVLDAECVFSPGANLPSSYALHDTKRLHLLFPTSLVIEERDDGTYYHFRRTYKARPFLFIESLKEQVSGDRIDELQKKEPKALSPAERLELIRYMARFEIIKRLTFARSAYLQVTPDAPQDGWLCLRAGMLALLEELDYPRIVKLLGSDEDEALALEAERFDEKTFAGFGALLRTKCVYSDEEVQRFQEAYRNSERAYEITEDLCGEKFEIIVEMPGELMGANGDAKGNHVTWKFDGKRLRDSDLELMATSRVKGNR